MIIDNQGSVVIFEPEGNLEMEWVMLNVDCEPWQWQGGGLVVDWRMAEDLEDGIRDAGFVVQHI